MSTTTTKCAAPLLEHPKATLAASGLPCWILSYDERSVSRHITTKHWKAAMSFIHQVSDLAEAAGHHPDVHLTNWRDVKIVLSTHSVGGLSQQDIDLATKIDALEIAYSPKWLREQQQQQQQQASNNSNTAAISTTETEEEAVAIDTSHYKFGLNGDFLQPDAKEKFGTGLLANNNSNNNNGSEDKSKATTMSPGLFENAETRDIAAAKDEIVKALRLKPGDVVADVGAGTGLLEPLLSQAVGDTGQVYCSEISPLFRQLLQERCRDYPNITILENPTDRDPKLPANNVDLVLLVDVYHHLEFPQTVLRRLREALDRHGALVVIDFHRDPARIQSHDSDWVYQHLRADQATFTKEIEATGFVQVEQVDVPGLPENYCLVFRKRPLALSTPGVGWTC